MRNLGIIGATILRRGTLMKLVTVTALGACVLFGAYGTARAEVTSVKAVKETGSGRRAAAATAVADEDEDEEQPARKKPARTRARKSA